MVVGVEREREEGILTKAHQEKRERRPLDRKITSGNVIEFKDKDELTNRYHGTSEALNGVKTLTEIQTQKKAKENPTP